MRSNCNTLGALAKGLGLHPMNSVCRYGSSDTIFGSTVPERSLWLASLPSGGALCASGLRKSAERLFEAAQEVESEDVPERRDAVLHPDLLALLVSPPAVGDRHLVDGDSELGHLCRDFNLEAESAAGNRHVADNLAAERLVAGFDIGHVDVGAQVGKKRQPLVGEVVVEVQHARRLAHQKE